MECECAKVCQHCRGTEDCNVFHRQEQFYAKGNLAERPVFVGQIVYYLSFKRDTNGDRIVKIKAAEVTGIRYDNTYNAWSYTVDYAAFRFGIYLDDVENNNDRLHNICEYADDLLWKDDPQIYLSKDEAEQRQQQLLSCTDKAFNDLLHNARRYL